MRRALLLLKILVSAGLIALLFSQVPVTEVWAALRGVHLPLALLAMLLYLAAIGTNVAKWALLLRAQGVRAPFGSLARHTFVGIFFNNFLPLVGADAVRGYGLARETSRGAGATVSVVVDRLVGLIAFASVGALSALLAARWPGVVGVEAVAPLGVVTRVGLLVTGGLLAALLLLLSGRVRRGVERLAGRVPLLRPLAPLVLTLSNAVSAYRRRPSALLGAYGIGLLTILFSNLVNLLLFRALSVPVEPLYVFIFNPIIALLLALPISIAGLGVNQSLFPALYGLAGVPAAPAVAVSLLLQLIIALVSLPGGFFWLTHRTPGVKQGVDAPGAARLP